MVSEFNANSSIDNVTHTYWDHGAGKDRAFVFELVDKGFEDGMIAYLFLISVISTVFNVLVLYLYATHKTLHR